MNAPESNAPSENRSAEPKRNSMAKPSRDEGISIMAQFNPSSLETSSLVSVRAHTLVSLATTILTNPRPDGVREKSKLEPPAGFRPIPQGPTMNNVPLRLNATDGMACDAQPASEIGSKL